MYEKNPKAVRYSLGTYHFLRNRVDSANGELPSLRVPCCLFFPLFAHAIGVYAGALGRGQVIDAPPAHLQ